MLGILGPRIMVVCVNAPDRPSGLRALGSLMPSPSELCSLLTAHECDPNTAFSLCANDCGLTDLHGVDDESRTAS